MGVEASSYNYLLENSKLTGFISHKYNRDKPLTKTKIIALADYRLTLRV
jgi:hypothetical protein